MQANSQLLSVYIPKLRLTQSVLASFVSINLNSVPQCFPDNLQQNKTENVRHQIVLKIFEDRTTLMRLASWLFMKKIIYMLRATLPLAVE